jgi:hypothetical protein
MLTYWWNVFYFDFFASFSYIQWTGIEGFRFQVKEGITIHSQANVYNFMRKEGMNFVTMETVFLCSLRSVWEHRHSADEDSQRDQKENESNLLKKNMIIHNTRKCKKVTKVQQIWTISTQRSKQNTNSTLEKKLRVAEWLQKDYRSRFILKGKNRAW